MWMPLCRLMSKHVMHPIDLIISKTPFRISLGGGGTDLPFYYEKEGGFVISSAIQKFMYVLVARRVHPNILLSYSKSELCESVEDVKHEIIKECLKSTGLTDHLVVLSHAELGSEYGLGSSGSFTVGLLNSLFKYNQKDITDSELASLACHINMDILKQPSGKQDEHIAAFGNMMSFEIKKDGNVIAKPLAISSETRQTLQNNLLFFHTNITRSAAEVLQNQHENSLRDPEVFEHLNKIKEIGLKTKKYFENGDVDEFGLLMDEHWNEKRKTSEKISNQIIDKQYERAKTLGALGGKIFGAGGGGLFMFYVNNDESKNNIRKEFNSSGMNEIILPFEETGSNIILNLSHGSQ